MAQLINIIASARLSLSFLFLKSSHSFWKYVKDGLIQSCIEDLHNSHLCSNRKKNKVVTHRYTWEETAETEHIGQ